jgi:hypothetical protein
VTYQPVFLDGKEQHMHHNEYELAEGVLADLESLRSRQRPATADEIMVIANRACNTATASSSEVVGEVRHDAWLAICTLADKMAEKADDVSWNWSGAIDLTKGWKRAAEES